MSVDNTGRTRANDQTSPRSLVLLTHLFCGQRDGDAAPAEVDHGDERCGGVVAEAVVEEAELAVEAFQPGVGQSEFDGGEDSFAVGAGHPALHEPEPLWLRDRGEAPLGLQALCLE